MGFIREINRRNSLLKHSNLNNIANPFNNDKHSVHNPNNPNDTPNNNHKPIHKIKIGIISRRRCKIRYRIPSNSQEI